MVSFSVPLRRSLSGIATVVSVTLTAVVLSAPPTDAAPGAPGAAPAPAPAPVSAKRAPVTATLFSGTFAAGRSDTTGSFCPSEGNQTAASADVPGSGRDLFLASSMEHTVDGGDGDRSTFDISSSSRTSTTVRNDVLRDFSFSVKAAVDSVVPLGPASDCDIEARGFGQLAVGASYPPGFLTVRMVVTDTATGSFAVEQGGLEGFGAFPRTAGTTESTGYVDGDYVVSLLGRAQVTRPESAGDRTSARGSIRIVGSYVGIGEATTKARGKARRFVSLAGSRACGTNTVTAKVTSKKRRVAKLRSVVVTVNGKRAAKVKRPTRGRTIRISRPAPAKDARVTAKVTLKNGSKRTVSRSYAACSD